MDGVYESESVLGLTVCALRADVHGALLWAGNVLGSCPLSERNPPGAPTLCAERDESESRTAQIDVLDLLRLYVDDAQARIALGRGPGDAEDERGVQRGPN